MPQKRQHFHIPAPFVAVAAWLIPGAGYMLLGQFARGLSIGMTICLLFVSGVLIGGIRVIDVPGFDRLGEKKIVLRDDPSRKAGPANRVWALGAEPMRTVFEKPWFVGQVLTGPICAAAGYWSVQVSKADNPGAVVSSVSTSHSRVWEIGTLYTAVAGMLNLMAIIDSSYRAGRVGIGRQS